MATKQCSKCRIELSVECFHKNAQQTSGLHPSCKECERRRAREYNSRPEIKTYRSAFGRKWRQENPEKYAEGYRRQNAKPENIERRKACSLRWQRSQEGREWHRGWAKSNNEKTRAYDAVKYAIRTGKLVRPAKCELCEVECKPHAHHYKGYSIENRLNVQWLCFTCHNRANKKPVQLN